MSLFFNMLSRLVTTFLPRSKSLLLSWLQSPFAVILKPQKIKSATVYTVSPSIGHEAMGLNMPTNLENSAVATGLEKVIFHSNPKERQCQRMLKLLQCSNLDCKEIQPVHPKRDQSWVFIGSERINS